MLLLVQDQFTSVPIQPFINPTHIAFLNELEGLNTNNGYPELTANYAIANGGLNGEPINDPPGGGFIFYSLSAGAASMSGMIGAIPSQESISLLSQQLGITIETLPIASTESLLTNFNTPCLPSDLTFDSCPGSYIEWFSNIEELIENEIEGIDVIVLQDKAGFIPTVSALGLKDYDIYTELAATPNFRCDMPFDAVTIPQTNEPHVELSRVTANWLYYKITNDPNEWLIDTNGKSYNFGATTSNTIFENTTISGDGKLHINSNNACDYFVRNSISPNINPQPTPETGSEFTVFTGCKGNEIHILDGGQLLLGDDNGNVGRLELLANSVLSLEDESEVVWKTDLKLLLETVQNSE